MAAEWQTIEAELATYDEKLMTILEDPTEARVKIEVRASLSAIRLRCSKNGSVVSLGINPIT